MKMTLLGLILIFIPMIVTAPNNYLCLETSQVYQEYTQKLLMQKRINRILETIRIIESTNNYHVKGSSGEYGMYQFTKTTWNYYCLKFFGQILDITIEENQDKIAYKKVEWLVKRELTDEQIASFWNSGRINWEGRVGINSYGVSYNVPEYVNKFINLLNDENTSDNSGKV